MRLITLGLALAFCGLNAQIASADSAASVSGYVLDLDTQRPVPQMPVAVVNSSWGQWHQVAISDRNGFFVSFGLDTGRIWLTAQPPRASGYSVGPGEARCLWPGENASSIRLYITRNPIISDFDYSNRGRHDFTTNVYTIGDCSGL